VARANSWIRVPIGLTLIAAAGLKGWELFGGSPSAGQGLPRWVQITAAEFEAILGVWLLSKWRAVWSQRVALGAFLVFFSVAATKAVRGEETCGCLGAVHFRPEWMALFDLGALTALWLWRPEPERAQTARAGTLLGPTTGLLAGVAFLSVGLGANLSLKPPAAADGVSVDAEEFDFGTVEPGQVVTHNFLLRNGLRVPVEIANVRSSCTCTTAHDVIGQVVEAGGTTPLVVTLRTGDGGRQQGNIDVYVKLPDGTVPEPKHLRVHAHAIQKYELSPRSIDFGVVTARRPVMKALRFRSLHAGVGVESVESSHPAFSVDATAMTAPDEREIRITFDPGKVSGNGVLTSVVSLRANSRRSPECTIMVQARVDNLLDVEPRAIVVSSQADGVVRSDLVLSSSQPCRVVSVAATPAGVAVSPKQTAVGQEHRLEVLVPDSRGAAFTGEIRLQISIEGDTTSSETSVVTVPVHRHGHK
jgi:hypothetical protein